MLRKNALSVKLCFDLVSFVVVIFRLTRILW